MKIKQKLKKYKEYPFLCLNVLHFIFYQSNISIISIISPEKFHVRCEGINLSGEWKNKPKHFYDYRFLVNYFYGVVNLVKSIFIIEALEKKAVRKKNPFFYKYRVRG